MVVGYNSVMASKSKPAQDFVPIQEIRNGIVILKNKSMRSILMVSSINFALKSLDEQNAIILQFQRFLNSLDFPIQILIQSRKRDIRPYIALLEKRRLKQVDDLMKIQIGEYIDFIKTFVENADVMSKHFFIVVPYTPTIGGTTSSGGFLDKLTGGAFGKSKKQEKKPEMIRLELFEENRTQINQRLAVVEQGLSSIGIRTAPLGTEELVELFYKMFNPGELTKPLTPEVVASGGESRVPSHES